MSIESFAEILNISVLELEHNIDNHVQFNKEQIKRLIYLFGSKQAYKVIFYPSMRIKKKAYMAVYFKKYKDKKKRKGKKSQTRKQICISDKNIPRIVFLSNYTPYNGSGKKERVNDKDY